MFSIKNISSWGNPLFKIAIHRRFQGSLCELKDYLFPCNTSRVGKISETFTSEQIRKEQAFFAADFSYAVSNGEPITKRVLQEMLKVSHVWDAFTGKLPKHHLIIDSRIHELQIGEFPAIPGWHTDFVERTIESSMQPDYRIITPTIKTYVINLSSSKTGVSNTEFLGKSVRLNIPKEDVYRDLDDQISRIKAETVKAVDGEIFEMDQLSLHRATPTHEAGMRFFLRLAVIGVDKLPTTILQKKPQNEIRTHVQTYRGIPHNNQSEFSELSRSSHESICDHMKKEELTQIIKADTLLAPV